VGPLREVLGVPRKVRGNSGTFRPSVRARLGKLSADGLRKKTQAEMSAESGGKVRDSVKKVTDQERRP
jgi:hypothetical protein